MINKIKQDNEPTKTHNYFSDIPDITPYIGMKVTLPMTQGVIMQSGNEWVIAQEIKEV